MTYTLTEDRTKKGSELRTVIMTAIQDMMETNENIVMLEADLGGASKSTIVQESHPDRYIQCGISEANMVGVAAGLSTVGFIPYLHTFAPFFTRRALDQIYLSGAYAHNTLNIYGSDPGFTVAANGGTHTSFGDAACMREIPDVVIVDPCDAVQMDWCVRQFATMKGVHYFRGNRKAVRNVYEPGSTFELGKANVLRPGSDVLIVAMGQLVSEALDAAEQLDKEGISAEVVDMFTLKPFDAECILRESAGKKAVVTFENHSIYGGLGSAAAEVMAQHNVGIPLKIHGVNDCFGQVGTADYLQKVFGLRAEDLMNSVREVLK
ncbi:transketolase family protein [Catenisphaera adipataccumulans]|uniref:Transketolase n=1 Tax=Catenisphaera adipataccumulans TaxID=700500 RepID=A0A7W8CZ76_9FIRM|nr:transketolase C-terminal domain-containing protein [Catenisphaera adipataccumulans]MBB5183123.1 transketolase [Catenisphaera adipataccumulans]